MLNGVLTRWELTPEEKFLEFYNELQEYLKKKLIYCPTQDGQDDWAIDFNYADYADGYLPDANPFKHAYQFCIDRHYDWWEVREMISEYKGVWVLDDAEILRDFYLNGKRIC